MLMGEMLKRVQKNTGAQGQLRGRESSGGSRVEPPEPIAPTLAEQGITKKQSMVAQSLATVRVPAPAARRGDGFRIGATL
ncbi:unnamed protein product [Gemmata massiliana]|uniref:Uncharacterized protein n=1 Tax=Gemmata massiliana TaxID=1210884 RepID=A0A6P2D9J4_9BACT|nr:unnamed protein product [Gemmata massiliana]